MGGASCTGAVQGHMSMAGLGRVVLAWFLGEESQALGPLVSERREKK